VSDVVIEVDGLWKKYRLGVLGTGTLRHDFNRWLHRLAGKPDLYSKVGEAQKSEVRSQASDNGNQKTDDRSQMPDRSGRCPLASGRGVSGIWYSRRMEKTFAAVI
jgi:ribosomal protein S4